MERLQHDDHLLDDSEQVTLIRMQQGFNFLQFLLQLQGDGRVVAGDEGRGRGRGESRERLGEGGGEVFGVVILAVAIMVVVNDISSVPYTHCTSALSFDTIGTHPPCYKLVHSPGH